MINPKEMLGSLDAGRVLDVATGSGAFLHLFLEGVKSYSEIIGIDTSERAEAAFEKAFVDNKNIHFEKGDFLLRAYPSESFDTLTISNSMHHFSEPSLVMKEIYRVLKPNGTAILCEMFSDVSKETQKTHVLMHEWWGKIDTLTGIVHNATYTKEELKQIFLKENFSSVTEYELSETEEDPLESELIQHLDSVIDTYNERAKGHTELQAFGEVLRKRVHEIGYHSATSLMLIGKK